MAKKIIGLNNLVENYTINISMKNYAVILPANPAMCKEKDPK